MVTNNKVLTVSYGTFSCTLEGFDDSFDTMKAIAEYFRDLAADDRYFGAEPPTPDAEMLARIAEREVERRVQARTEHGAIVLTTAEAAAAQEAARADALQKDTEQPVAAEPVEDLVEETAEAAVEPEPEMEPEMEIVDVTDAVLEAVTTDAEEEVEDTAEIEEPAEVVAQDDVIELVPEDEIFEDPEVDAAVDLSPAQDDAEETEIVLLDDTSDVSEDIHVEDTEDHDDVVIADILEASEEEIAEAKEFVAEVVEPEPAPQPEPEPETDSIAAKLQRIRAVVSKSRDEPEDDFSEDEHAEPLIAEAPSEPEPVLTLDSDMAAAAVAMDAETTQDSSEEDEVQPVRARVIRMKKADLEAAVDTGLLEAEAYEDDEDDQNASSLSAEEEAELMAELAQVEAELNGEIDDDEPVEAIGAEIDEFPPRSERGRHLTDGPGQSEADMARLLQETDTQMEEPDGSRRRQAIAHLRAAVAATKAEQKAGKGNDRPRDTTEAYRGDLASVMRPSSAETRKKSGQPPLKLVAEQRIDPEQEVAKAKETPEETPRASVRPRRVSAVDRNERADASPVGLDAGNFAEFAESVGAHDLPEVLEAAAAYLTFVEKLDVFSRPMIVRMAQGMGGESFSREDSLRGFGQLLRENKITKVSGGRFTASDEIGFRPQDRAAG